MKYKNEYYKELFRRLEQLGLGHEVVGGDFDYANIYRDTALVCVIESDGTLRGYENYDKELYKIRQAAKEVSDYVNEYMKAEHLDPSTRLEDYRKLLDLGGYILAAKQLDNGGFSFVTWKADPYGGYIWGNYFDDYKKACEDFANRSGIIDKNTIFDEIELKLIYSNLIHYVKLNPEISYENEKSIGKILDRIEGIVPEIKERNEQNVEVALKPPNQLGQFDLKLI
jgi:hypothetical protein